MRAAASRLALLLLAGCIATRRLPDDVPVVTAPPPTTITAPRDTAPTAEPVPQDEAPERTRESAFDVRVALPRSVATTTITATGSWRLYDARDAVLLRALPAEPWQIEAAGSKVRAVRFDGTATPWQEGYVTARVDGEPELLRLGQRRYRGALRVFATDSGALVVNILPLESYLRGVVPLEIGGPRAPNEQAAVEAQAIAARSYTVVRRAAALRSAARAAFYDLLASTSDQVYGGVEAERAFSDAAVASTRGQVLRYGGRVVDAPYHASCGGETAAPSEVWGSGVSGYLRRVDDRIPGTSDRYYCDIAPRFAWTRSVTGNELAASMERYLRTLTAVPAGGPGRARTLSIDGRTGSGRVARLTLGAERGTFSIRGNDARSVLRAAGGEALPSAYFSLDTETGPDGAIARVTIRGNGFGHGVGMCQWGAIGRARAGFDVRSILRAYYPGTEIGGID
ncbi:MAG: SpoIID/LytB domain-containing protein [Gemmatimonadaceae bacterium]|nr:SpoIID/LytB domain-containing protein [Gemmatimonadaceae bacterium]